MTAKELWSEYTKNNCSAEYEAWQFGTDADHLACLVVKGKKTATSSLYAWYKDGKEKLPLAGNYQIILNTKNEAVCIIQTKKVACVPFEKVTKEHAFQEGEGDQSLEYWKRVHKAVFMQEAASMGEEFSEQSLVVCEEFSCVYVPGHRK